MKKSTNKIGTIFGRGVHNARYPYTKLFSLPNVIFRIGLGSGEISVYAYLMYCENKGCPFLFG